MAIPFLNHLDLRSVSELQNALLHKTTTATASNVEAKIIYDTGTNSLQYYNGTTWINLDGSGDISAVVAGTYLNGGGTSGSVTLNHDSTTRSDTTSTDAPAFGGTFEAVTSVTTNATGHVTAIDVSTVTIPASPTITLSGEVTGSGTTSITTTVSNNVLDIDNFTLATIVTEAEGIANNDNDTTLPTSAAVKDYVDTAIVGGLVYQGGYDAATNTPDLDSSPSASIKKGWTYTVTADGSFFTEQVRVGDVLIAENDAPTTLAEWTTVQNNIDLASLTQVGIGNVNAGTGISVSYSNGTATVTNTETNSDNSFATTVTASGTINYPPSFAATRDVIVQLYDTVTYETVYADVERTSTTSITITFASTPTNSIRVLVQKIG